MEKPISELEKEVEFGDVVMLNLYSGIQMCTSIGGIDRYVGFFWESDKDNVYLGKYQKNTIDMEKAPACFSKNGIDSYQILAKYKDMPKDGIDEVMQSLGIVEYECEDFDD